MAPTVIWGNESYRLTTPLTKEIPLQLLFNGTSFNTDSKAAPYHSDVKRCFLYQNPTTLTSIALGICPLIYVLAKVLGTFELQNFERGE